MPTTYKWIPVIDPSKCTGCNSCVEACAPGCLALVNKIAVLVDAEICGSEEHCIPVCKDEAIKMAWVPLQGDPNIGKWRVA